MSYNTYRTLFFECREWKDKSPDLLTDSILVNGPDSGHMRGKELVLRKSGVTCSGTDQPRFAHSIVPHHHTFNGLNIRPLIFHVSICKLGPKSNG